MQVVVVGSKGFIGRSVVVALKTHGLSICAVSSHPDSGMLQLDLLKPADFFYNHINNGDVVLVAAAVSSPDVCRDKYDLAYAINVVGTGYFIERCLGLGARVVFLSSDTVYGGAEEECNEDSICVPAGEYAIMKQEIENRFIEHPFFKTLRLSYVFSRNDKFTSYLSACVRDNREAEIFHPMFRRAVYLNDLLELIKVLCLSWDNVPEKIINVCGPDLISRVDMATLYFEIVSPALQFRVVEPPPGFFIARPQVINMSNKKLIQLIGCSPKSIADAMYLEFTKQKGLP